MGGTASDAATHRADASTHRRSTTRVILRLIAAATIFLSGTLYRPPVGYEYDGNIVSDFILPRPSNPHVVPSSSSPTTPFVIGNASSVYGEGSKVYDATNPLGVRLTPTTGGNLPRDFEQTRRLYIPKVTHDGIDVAYFHMLQIRAGAPRACCGSTGNIHSQWQTMYWKTRERYVRGLVRTVCEVGLGSGYSGVVLLTATTNTSWHDDGASFHSFDNGLDNEGLKKRPAYEYMMDVFGGRVHFHFGPQSSDEIRKWKASHPNFVCDVVFIDADHSADGVAKDIDAAHSVSRSSTLLFFDDYNFAGINKGLDMMKELVDIETVYTQNGETDWTIQSAETRRSRKQKKDYLVAHFKNTSKENETY